MKAASNKASDEAALLTALYATAAPATTTAGASKLYYPIMYFVDKAFVDSPSTCGGTPAADPIVGSHDECATACEAKDRIHHKSLLSPSHGLTKLE